MATLIMSEPAIEGSTCVIQVDFYDESENPVTPTSATWTLTDSSGSVVNSREDEIISSLDTTVYIVLSGADLVTNSHSLEELTLTITATYNSAYGSGLPMIAQGKIPVEAV